ncbi:CaiB/BaiF CoA transferase family protein [Effusibacillus dendaii]|uniref:CoA transferase n=1 Tax=Effusibacillus dendaii TaxID=2743772 RepID=A0A7I8DD24_9BACL|nr:CaiB/BaiF CoA-transferase family protein [Effusibacillus dendaii]BCJ86849.1 CoA transferase [Effusibacillus dendaii]
MRALEGLIVIDLTRVLAGPYCTMLLGDLGADVIKIEGPGGSDETRTWGPPFKGDQSAYYLTANRNKRALTLNLKDPEARDILREMVRTADVLIQNFKTGSMEKWGLSYEDLSQLNPGLVYCSISGFGQYGPYSELPGYDYIVQAMGGMMSITGSEQSGPMKVGVAIADLATGMYCTIAILAALRERESSGKGQHLDISLLDSQISLLANVASNYLVSGQIPKRYGNEHPNIVPYQTFATRDGEMVVTVGNDRQFQKLCQLIGLPQLAENPDFQTNSARVANRERLIEILQAEFNRQTSQEWLKQLTSAGIPAGPINNMQDLFNDPHVTARDMKVEIPHPTVGSVTLVGSPLKLSRTPVEIRRHPPLPGEHADEILREYGFTEEQIRDWRARGII